jgi:hypothetical protein
VCHGKLICVGTGYRRKEIRLEIDQLQSLCVSLERMEWTVKSWKSRRESDKWRNRDISLLRQPYGSIIFQSIMCNFSVCFADSCWSFEFLQSSFTYKLDHWYCRYILYTKSRPRTPVHVLIADDM